MTFLATWGQHLLILSCVDGNISINMLAYFICDLFLLSFKLRNWSSSFVILFPLLPANPVNPLLIWLSRQAVSSILRRYTKYFSPVHRGCTINHKICQTAVDLSARSLTEVICSIIKKHCSAAEMPSAKNLARPDERKCVWYKAEKRFWDKAEQLSCVHGHFFTENEDSVAKK